MNKKVALGSLLLASSMILAACAPAAAPTVAPTAKPAEPTKAPATAAPTAVPPTVAPTAVPPTATPKPIEVTLWHSYGTGSAEETALAELVKGAAASADLAGVKINVLQVPFNDIFNKYKTDVAAGGGPSMFVAPNDSLGDDSRAKLYADITDLAKGKLDGYGKLAVDGMTVDGKLYGIPESLKAVALFYNKDLLKEVPKTTDDLMKAVNGGTKISLSLGCYHQWGFYSGFGAKIFDDKNAFVNSADNQAALANAYKFLNDWWVVAKKAGIPKSDGDAAAPFKEGKIAATANGNWALGDYQKALGDKLGVAPLPAGPKGNASPLLGVDGFYFNPNNKNDVAQAALKVALYLTSAASQKVMAEKAGHVPARTGVTYDNALVKAFEGTFANAMVRPQATTMGKYWGNFCGDGDIFEKGVAPAEFVKKAFEGATK
ncbi:MAG: extracellular solute-binding protein [Thermoflexales bacterium]|nr:extracellular solute-binding protein [Thermoflexales bacterium]